MAAKKFDLNIEKILEDWEVYHAIREIISNAIDEQILTKTKDIEIFKDGGNWHVRDYGRGLKYEHLTQKENEEKLKNPNVIGKFGIGLKDALATFDRKGIKVYIKSRHGDITLEKSEKHGFEDVITLHANIAVPSDKNFVGTGFVLAGASDDDISRAKDLFLRFSGEKAIEKTSYGEVLEKKCTVARIYINGVRVAEEENFLFSYNITALNSAIRKALNRERTNVGRTGYSERVKSILISCQSKGVAERLVDDLKNYQSGEIHEELKWIDVQERAVKILNATSKVVFLTPGQMISETMMVDEAKSAGYEIVTIPENLQDRIKGQADISGNPIRELGQFFKEYRDSFEFMFVERDDLTTVEREVFDKTDGILSLVGGKPSHVKQIVVSETMRKELGSFSEAEGVWEPGHGRIVVKRSVLKSLENYAGTLLHELAHARSGATDVTRDFELELTKLLGISSAQAIQENPTKS